MASVDKKSTKRSAPPARSPFPSVDFVLLSPSGQLVIARFGREAATNSIRSCLQELRNNRSSEGGLHDAADIARTALDRLIAADASTLRPLFNLTGTVLHTNLGRAILPEEAVEAVAAVMRDATNLEYDIETGRRGERDDHVRGLVCELTGAEDCVIVNNAAAAVLLVLSSLSAGRETIVSRGELIEIGGSFRIPDIMRRAGAKLREVGTTNRTHPADYREAITARTASIMKVHTSNYRIEGFTAEVEPEALAELAHAHGLPLIDDLGSGTLIDLSRYGIKRERTVQDALKDGADLVLFSGDKLLGGPQVGIIAGRKDLVQRCARNHLKRALRVDKLRLAALAATLKLYRNPETLPEKLPTLRYFTRQRAELAAIATRLKEPLQTMLGSGWIVDVVDLKSQIGSGALPLETMDSAGLSVTPGKGVSGRALDALAKRLRGLPMPVIGRIHDSGLLLDLRCLDDIQRFEDQLHHLKARQ
ncbi:MAG: L-seryl-tRNA(Sec) selenium transferase [Beijerinckiaceae bacterium]